MLFAQYLNSRKSSRLDYFCPGYTERAQWFIINNIFLKVYGNWAWHDHSSQYKARHKSSYNIPSRVTAGLFRKSKFKTLLVSICEYRTVSRPSYPHYGNSYAQIHGLNIETESWPPLDMPLQEHDQSQFAQNETLLKIPGPCFNIKISSYQYRKSHCGDKTILRPSYLHNGISYTGKMTSLYWIRALLWMVRITTKFFKQGTLSDFWNLKDQSVKQLINDQQCLVMCIFAMIIEKHTKYFTLMLALCVFISIPEYIRFYGLPCGVGKSWWLISIRPVVCFLVSQYWQCKQNLASLQVRVYQNNLNSFVTKIQYGSVEPFQSTN